MACQPGLFVHAHCLLQSLGISNTQFTFSCSLVTFPEIEAQTVFSTRIDSSSLWNATTWQIVSSLTPSTFMHENSINGSPGPGENKKQQLQTSSDCNMFFPANRPNYKFGNSWNPKVYRYRFLCGFGWKIMRARGNSPKVIPLMFQLALVAQ